MYTALATTWLVIFAGSWIHTLVRSWPKSKLWFFTCLFVPKIHCLYWFTLDEKGRPWVWLWFLSSAFYILFMLLMLAEATS